MNLMRNYDLTDKERAKAKETAVSIGKRVREYFMSLPPEETPVNQAEGCAGVVLYLTALARDGRLDSAGEAERDHFLKLCLERRSGTFGLFQGWCGITLALVSAYGAKQEIKPISSIRKATARYVEESIPNPYQRPRFPSDFDLISGLSGILLTCDCDTRTRIFDYFRWLVADPAERFAVILENHKERLVDVGMAHGISGVVASLSLVRGDGKLIDSLCHFIASRATISEPRFLAFTRAPVDPFVRRPRPSWCYGGLGIAAAFLAAGIYLNSAHLKKAAMAAALAVTDSAGAYWDEVDSTLCHGTAGNALILTLIARRLGDEELANRALLAYRTLLESYDASTTFGYRRRGVTGEWEDAPGLLM